MNSIRARFLPSLAALLLAACAGPFSLPGTSSVPKPEQIAPDVYAVIGATEKAAPANHGVVGNVGILIGDTGVVLIDTGTSARFAEQLLDDVHALTDKPVVLAIDTHQNPAFVFGNGTLIAHGIPVLAHRDTDALVNARCHRCLKMLKEALGAEAMAGTEVVRPTRTVDGPVTLTAGGRTIDILYHGKTSAPGAIAVYDRKSGVLFGGGMVSIDRIPDAKDADLTRWREALERLRALHPAKVVPGEGPVSSPDRLADLEGYLAALGPAAKAAYRSGASLSEAAALPQAQVPAYRDWALYKAIHGKNIESLYLRQEKAALDKP